MSPAVTHEVRAEILTQTRRGPTEVQNAPRVEIVDDAALYGVLTEQVAYG